MCYRLISAFILLASLAAGQQLVYSTYLQQAFWPSSVSADAAGNLYLAGVSGDSAIPQNFGGHALITKLTPDGKNVVYTRDLGPSFGSVSIAVNDVGDAYITGSASPSGYPIPTGLPVTNAGPQLGPGPSNGLAGFLAKLDPQGKIVFAEFIGGSNYGSAVALTPAGDILVSGLSGPGFRSSPGAYNVPDTTGRPFLLELDAGGTNVIFSATGIGGSAIRLDATGNIFIAGATTFPDYPTTPGAYESPLPQTSPVCFLLCQIGGSAGTSQYVTKVDPTGSTLMYSTGVNDGAFSTANTGLAVDSYGSAYIAATVNLGGQYTPTLTKLDPTGRSAVFSVPVGGSGVSLDSSGNVYVSGWSSNHVLTGAVNFPVGPVPAPAGFSNLPDQCLPNNFTGLSSATVSMVDASDGSVKSAQWIDGSSVTVGALAWVNGKIWVAGSTTAPDVSVTPGAVLSATLPVGVNGDFTAAYLGAIDFTLGGPQIACVLDSASLFHLSSVAPNQLISLFGTNFDSKAGVTVTFDGVPAKILYASPSQVNVVVPANVQNTTVMQVMSNNQGGVPRQLVVTADNPSLFIQFLPFLNPLGQGTYTPFALARNEDGSFNSSTQPAPLGSVVSLYLNGAGLAPVSVQVLAGRGPQSLIDAEVLSTKPESDSVWRIDVRMPATKPPGSTSFLLINNVQSNGLPVHPGSSGAYIWVSP